MSKFVSPGMRSGGGGNRGFLSPSKKSSVVSQRKSAMTNQEKKPQQIKSKFNTEEIKVNRNYSAGQLKIKDNSLSSNSFQSNLSRVQEQPEISHRQYDQIVNGLSNRTNKNKKKSRKMKKKNSSNMSVASSNISHQDANNRHRKESGPAQDQQYQNEEVKNGEHEIEMVSEGDFDESINIDDINEQIEIDNLHDIRISNEYYTKIKVTEFISVFFATYGICLSVLLYEMKDQTSIDSTRNMVLTYNVFCTIALMLSIFFRYDLYLKWAISRGLLTEHDSILNTGAWKEQIIEQLVVIIAPYPYLDSLRFDEYNEMFDTTVQYDLNDILLFFCFCRIYLLIRYILVITQFMNPRSQRVCMMNGCEANAMFAIKSIMKQKPYTILWVSLLLSTLIFGYQLKIFEGPISAGSQQNFKNLGNAIWNVIITMATVGYGDIYPKTAMGRFVGVLICFWGVFIVSFFVVTLNNMLTFTANEEKAYSLLLRLYYKEQLKQRACFVLSAAYKQKIAQKNPEQKRKILTAIRIFRMHMIRFQYSARSVRSFYEADTDVEIMQKLIENLMEEVDELKANQATIQTNIERIAQYIEHKIQQDRISNNNSNNSIED